MKLTRVPANVLASVVTLLSPYCRGISESRLISALRDYVDEPHAGIKPVLTKHEAARLCKVSPYTIIRMVKSGRLPGVKVSGQWRIPAAAVVSLVTGENSA